MLSLERLRRFVAYPAAWRRHLLRVAAWNTGYRIAGAGDGFPIPPAGLIHRVIGTPEAAWYRLGGVFSHRALTALLRRNGVRYERCRRLLDFGCGSGRLLRHWAALRPGCELWGTDVDPALVAWCAKHLSRLGRFAVNRAAPPLELDGGSFELVYAYSVFTHLDEQHQTAWLRELARVLVPGGVLALTTHGPSAAVMHELQPEPQARLARDGFLVVSGERNTKNDCVAYHTPRFLIRAQQRVGLQLVDYAACGTHDASSQDVYLLRKPGSSAVSPCPVTAIELAAGDAAATSFEVEAGQPLRMTLRVARAGPANAAASLRAIALDPPGAPAVVATPRPGAAGSTDGLGFLFETGLGPGSYAAEFGVQGDEAGPWRVAGIDVWTASPAARP